MKSFFSLIKVTSNSQAGDNITIGLFVNDSSGISYAFSKNKISIAKDLLVNSENTIDFIESQIISKIKESNYKSISSNILLRSESALNAEYIKYLSKYNNGVLQFTEPKLIADVIDDVKFNKLFELYVDKIETTDSKSTDKNKDFYSRINNNLISKVHNRIHTRAKLDNNIIPSILGNFEIDCIGKNGVLIGAKSLPLTQSKQTISHNSNSYINVIVHLSLKFGIDISKNNFYLISDEPELNSEVYHIWEKLNKETLFKIVGSDRLDEISNKIESTNATKFLELEN